MAVYAAEALLMAFALKLRVVKALAGGRPTTQRTHAGPTRAGLDASYLDKASGFLGACLPAAAFSPAGLSHAPPLTVRFAPAFFERDFLVGSLNCRKLHFFYSFFAPELPATLIFVF